MMSTNKNLWRLLSFDIIASILAVVRAVNRGKSPAVYFDEGGIMTWLSFVQLLACSGIAWRIFQLRKNHFKLNKDNRKSGILWLIISVGFLFLSIDEILEIHENADEMIIESLNLPKNGLTDRIDDLIVILYGLIAVGLLYFQREELKK